MSRLYTDSSGIEFIDVQRRLVINDEADMATIIRQQEVPDDFLRSIADRRHDSLTAPVGDLHYAGSIPAAVVEKWFAEGFNIFDPNVSLEDIMARLRREDMDRLIGTSKTL